MNNIIKKFNQDTIVYKVLKSFSWILMLGIVIILGINLFVVMSANQYIKDDIDSKYNIQAIVVLGARVMPDKTPSQMLKDRLDKAIDLYNSDIAPTIVVSGDHQTPYYNEVGVMKNYLMKNGVPEQAILMDHLGLCTYDSMINMVEKLKFDKFVVVTQGYHLKRAVYIARSMADAYGVPAAYYPYIQLPKYRLREAGARVKDFMKVSFRKN